MYVFLGSSHAIWLIVFKSYECYGAGCVIFSSQHVCVLTAVGIFFGVLFAIFVAVMFWDQISCIIDNTSTIDELKTKAGIEQDERSYASHERSGWENLKEVFGGADKPVNIWWLWPTEPGRELVIEREFD